jgi:hypothetical protein
MKLKLAGVGAKAVTGASLALLLCGLGTSARADAIPYPAVGTPNTAGYTFTAAADGDIGGRRPPELQQPATRPLGIPIDPMPRIERHSIDADRVVVAAMLEAFLATFVAVRA